MDNVDFKQQKLTTFVCKHYLDSEDICTLFFPLLSIILQVLLVVKHLQKSVRPNNILMYCMYAERTTKDVFKLSKANISEQSRGAVNFYRPNCLAIKLTAIYPLCV